jgi:hypothetical protein
VMKDYMEMIEIKIEKPPPKTKSGHQSEKADADINFYA